MEQRQKLTPQQVLQTVLLQLNSLDLEQRITEELAENPLLEVKETEPQEEEEETPQDSVQEDDLSWDDLINSPDDYRIPTRHDKQREGREMPIPYRPDPIDRLLDQIRLLDISQEERQIAEEIAWNIDERGYLATDIGIIADRREVSEKTVESVLEIVQKLDPPGVGTRDLKECLRVQLEVNGHSELALRIITDHFDDFANRRFEKLSANLGCSEEELNRAMEVIAHLNPKPGEGAPTSDADYIVPDFIVEDVDGELIVTVNDSNIPEIYLSPVYVNLMKAGNEVDPEVKKFLRKKLDSARWFLQAVHQRQITMLKVMKAILTRQEPFFREGVESLKPMVLKDIADHIRMDVSTISRVTRGKYVQTPYGTFELKYFFSEGMTTESGEEVSTKIVKEELRQVINEEDKRNPHSDDELAVIMKSKGYPIARRTVAKYREQMKTPVARLRREM